MTLTDILRVLQDIFLNFCGRISNSQPSLIRIHLQIEIYGMFSVCQCQITFYSLSRITLYDRHYSQDSYIIFSLFFLSHPPATESFYLSCFDEKMLWKPRLFFLSFLSTSHHHVSFGKRSNLGSLSVYALHFSQ